MKHIPLVQYLHGLLVCDDFDIRHKLQNMMLAVALAGSSFSTIKSFALDYNISRSILSLFATLTVFAAFYISVILRKRKAASYLACILIDLIIFPLLFIFSGGIYSSIPLWMVFGLVFPWFILEGVGCYVMFGLNLLAAVGCFVVQIFFPQIIAEPPAGDIVVTTAVDMAVGVAVIPIILGITVKY